MGCRELKNDTAGHLFGPVCMMLQQTKLVHDLDQSKTTLKAPLNSKWCTTILLQWHIDYYFFFLRDVSGVWLQLWLAAHSLSSSIKVKAFQWLIRINDSIGFCWRLLSAWRVYLRERTRNSEQSQLKHNSHITLTTLSWCAYTTAQLNTVGLWVGTKETCW